MMHNRRICEISACQTCWQMARAHLNLITNPRARLTGPTRQQSDPVLWHDAQTSYHDLRAALAFAGGATTAEVDPCTGHYLVVAPVVLDEWWRLTKPDPSVLDRLCRASRTEVSRTNEQIRQGR